VTRLAPALHTEVLVIHDRGDGEVPWQHGHAIARAWPGARVLDTDGLGHRRILRDPLVVSAAVEFLASHAVCAGRAGAPGLDGDRLLAGGGARPAADRSGLDDYARRWPTFTAAGSGMPEAPAPPSCASTGPQYVGP
jgi:hypothetical protein